MVPSPAPLPNLRQRVATATALILQNTRQTRYQHAPVVVDPQAGTYELDCSEFVSLVLLGVAPRHYARIPREPAQPCPRAFEYCDYFQSLVYDPTSGWRCSYDVDGALVYEAAQGWRRLGRLSEARAGDVLAWRFARWAPGADTGHVLVVASRPVLMRPDLFAVRVMDSSALPHFEDTRDQNGVFGSGVGEGTLLVRVDGAGAPIAVQFGPGDRVHSLPIVIGRLEPLGA